MTASVTLELDNRPPRVAVVASPIVPPADGLVIIAADKPIADWVVTTTDVLRAVQILGGAALDSHTVEVRIPSGGLIGGTLILNVSVADEVGNRMTRNQEILVQSPKSVYMTSQATPALVIETWIGVVS